MRPIIIVSHGQPSDPAPAAADLVRLSTAVAGHLPGWVVRSATLAEPDALDQLVRTLGDGGALYPLFMAGGWFARINLPNRLAAAGGRGWQVLEPFGCDPALHDLAATVLAEALPDQDPADAQVLLAAHGSFKSPVPSDIAFHVAQLIQEKSKAARVEAAFIDQTPQLKDVAGFDARSICLPFFAAAGGHVTDDIPAALNQAGFKGRILPPLGLDPRVPAIIAAAIRGGIPVCADECRYRSTGRP